MDARLGGLEGCRPHFHLILILRVNSTLSARLATFDSTKNTSFCIILSSEHWLGVPALFLQDRKTFLESGFFYKQVLFLFLSSKYVLNFYIMIKPRWSTYSNKRRVSQSPQRFYRSSVSLCIDSVSCTLQWLSGLSVLTIGSMYAEFSLSVDSTECKLRLAPRWLATSGVTSYVMSFLDWLSKLVIVRQIRARVLINLLELCQSRLI